MKLTLEQRASLVASKGIFLGGPIDIFEDAGRKTFMLMLDQGLMPENRVIDVGCGCLRNGYWLIHFLQEGNYFGIEPNISMVAAGRDIIVGEDVISLKKPVFDNNDRFNFMVFSSKFDMFLARSIWTHASKHQIEVMLDGFTRTAAVGAKLLTSIHEALTKEHDYIGTSWVGLSHESVQPGMVAHSLAWIEQVCAARALKVSCIRDRAFDIADQTWLVIERE